jgi:hypothetical protein
VVSRRWEDEGTTGITGALWGLTDIDGQTGRPVRP